MDCDMSGTGACADESLLVMQKLRFIGPVLTLCLLLALVLLSASAVQAASFISAFYDPQTDELVVTLSYRGSNPDHEFTLVWGDCRTANGTREISASILDSQWNDRALELFTKAVRFGLS